MWPLDSDVELLLLFSFTVVVVSLLLLLQVYMICFLRRAASLGHLPTSGPVLSARNAAVSAAMADGAGPDLGGNAGPWESLPEVSCGWGGDEEAGDCVVCLSALEDSDGRVGSVRVLPRCRHAFHAGCIGRWLVSHSVCCPICRTPVRAPDPAASAAAATTPLNPPLMPAPVGRDEEEGWVLGAMGGHLAERGVVLPGEEQQILEELRLPLLL